MKSNKELFEEVVNRMKEDPAYINPDLVNSTYLGLIAGYLASIADDLAELRDNERRNQGNVETDNIDGYHMALNDVEKLLIEEGFIFDTSDYGVRMSKKTSKLIKGIQGLRSKYSKGMKQYIPKEKENDQATT